MKIGVYTNLRNDPGCKVARVFTHAALQAGFECAGQCECDFEAGVTKFGSVEELTSWADMLVVIGGDGTVLNLAAAAARKGVPVLPVHNGSLGFLTEITPSEIKQAVKFIAEKKYDIEHRSMLETKLNGEVHIALNEILVARKNRSGICKLSAYCDGVYFDTYSGDGVIISTPTGSTGYSLSAGGPVLSPKVKAMILTPLCVHALNGRAIVFDANEVLTIKVDGKDDFNCMYVDGRQINHDIQVGSAVEIYKSLCEMKFVRFSEKSFYARMYSKLESWHNRH